jgi:uncharacterized protein (DUF433 family)
MKILGKGVYDIKEAARITGLDRAKIRRWFRGTGGKRPTSAIFTSDYADVSEGIALSFHDLIELNIGGQFRDRGFSFQYLRRVHNSLSDRWKTEHPFCMKQLATDGKQIFVIEMDEEEKGIVYDVEAFQLWFDAMVLPILDRIDYDQTTSLASRMHLGESIVVDPALSFGKPIVESVGITTRVLALAYTANSRNAEMVADWYGIKPEHVLAAVEFEERQPGTAA